MRLNAASKNAPIIRTRLHHQGKRRKLGCSVINLQAKEVLLQE